MGRGSGCDRRSGRRGGDRVRIARASWGRASGRAPRPGGPCVRRSRGPARRGGARPPWARCARESTGEPWSRRRVMATSTASRRGMSTSTASRRRSMSMSTASRRRAMATSTASRRRAMSMSTARARQRRRSRALVGSVASRGSGNSVAPAGVAVEVARPGHGRGLHWNRAAARGHRATIGQRPAEPPDWLEQGGAGELTGPAPEPASSAGGRRPRTGGRTCPQVASGVPGGSRPGKRARAPADDAAEALAGWCWVSRVAPAGVARPRTADHPRWGDRSR